MTKTAKKIEKDNPADFPTEKPKDRKAPTRSPYYEIARLKTEQTKIVARFEKIQLSYHTELEATNTRLKEIDTEVEALEKSLAAPKPEQVASPEPMPS